MKLTKTLLSVFSIATLSACGKVSGSLKGISQSDTNSVLKTSQGIYTITEGSALSIVALLNNGRNKDTKVKISLNSNRPSSSNRFQEPPTETIIKKNELTHLIILNSVDDNIYEGTETFQISLSFSDDKGKEQSTNATIVLSDNDNPPSVAIADQASANESGSITFTVTLTGNTALPASVHYSLANGTAAAGADYTSSSGSLSFPVGLTTQNIVIPILNDSLNEGNETLTVSLSDAVDATISDASALGTITDDDAAPTLSVADVSLQEGTGAGTTTATFSVVQSAVSGRDITLNYVTSNGTALAGSDYTSSSGSATIAAGSSTTSITIPISRDALGELDENFTLTLSGGSGYDPSGSDLVAIGTITNDDLGFNITGITSATDGTKDSNLNGSLRPIVNWERAIGATRYDVTIFEADGSTIKCATATVVDPGIGTEVAKDFLTDCSGGDLTGGSTYQVKVESSNGSMTAPAFNSLYSFRVNRAPALHAGGNGPWYVLSGGSLSINSIWSAAPDVGVADDADGDTLTFSAVASPASAIATTANNSSSVTYSAGVYTGVDTFSFTISDNYGGSVSGTMTVHSVTAFTWTGSAGDRNWATNSNWCGAINTNKTGCTNSGVEPTNSATTTHVAILDDTCQAAGDSCSPNANANANYTMYGLKIANTSVIFTQVSGKTMTIGAGGHVQSAGGFLGSDANVSHTGPLILSGGTYRATSATTTSGNIVVSGSPSFTANGGTFAFSGDAITPGGIEFHNVVFNGALYSNCTLTGTMVVNGNLTHSGANGSAINGGTVKVKGDWTFTSNMGSWGGPGTTEWHISGSGTQTITGFANGMFGPLTIDSTGTINLAGDIYVYSNLTYSQGTVIAGASKVAFVTSGTINPGNIEFNNVSFVSWQYSTHTIVGTIKVKGTTTNSGDSSTPINGGVVEMNGDWICTTSHGTWGGPGTTHWKLVGPSLHTVSNPGGCLRGKTTVDTTGTVVLDGTLKFYTDFTYVNGVIDYGTSTVHFMSGSISPGLAEFNNVSFSGWQYQTATLTGTVIANGNLTMSGGSCTTLNGGTLDIKGNLTYTTAMGSWCGGGSVSMRLIGAGTQVYTPAGNALPARTFTIAKSGGTFSLAGHLTLPTSQSMTVSSGSVDMTGYNLTIPGTLTLNGQTVSKNSGTLTVGGVVAGTGSLFGGTVNP